MSADNFEGEYLSERDVLNSCHDDSDNSIRVSFGSGALSVALSAKTWATDQDPANSVFHTVGKQSDVINLASTDTYFGFMGALDESSGALKALSSIVVDGSDCLNVNLKGVDGFTVNVNSADIGVHTTEANDSVLVYGNDGATNRAILTDNTGVVQVNVLKGNLAKIKDSNDYVQTITWTDADHVDTIVHSSVTLSLSVTETFVYDSTYTDNISTITLS